MAPPPPTRVRPAAAAVAAAGKLPWSRCGSCSAAAHASARVAAAAATLPRRRQTKTRVAAPWARWQRQRRVAPSAAARRRRAGGLTGLGGGWGVQGGCAGCGGRTLMQPCSASGRQAWTSALPRPPRQSGSEGGSCGAAGRGRGGSACNGSLPWLGAWQWHCLCVLRGLWWRSVAARRPRSIRNHHDRPHLRSGHEYGEAGAYNAECAHPGLVAGTIRGPVLSPRGLRCARCACRALLPRFTCTEHTSRPGRTPRAR